MATTVENYNTEEQLSSKWKIDLDHSEIGFIVRHLMITNVRGVFKEFGATIKFEEEESMACEINFWLNVASIDTNSIKRDEHLKSSDFFDETKNRLITFIGKSFENTSKQNSYVLLGDLTMKGITNQIKLDVVFDGKMTDPYGNQKSGYTINGTINRKKWGLNWNGLLEAGGVVVSEEVKICCEVQLIKQL